jgi:hypothetical protein
MSAHIIHPFKKGSTSHRPSIKDHFFAKSLPKIIYYSIYSMVLFFSLLAGQAPAAAALGMNKAINMHSKKLRDITTYGAFSRCSGLMAMYTNDALAPI